MEDFYYSPGTNTPEIYFSPEKNIFFIRGKSAPEDVRAIYYPVIQYISELVDSIIKGGFNTFSSDNPLRFQVDLTYFNSTSAKFIYDIFSELKRLPPGGYPILVEWIHEEEDEDMRDAGADIALLVGMDFSFVSKTG